MKIEKSLRDALVSLAQMNSLNCLSEDVIFQYSEQEGLSLAEISRVCKQLEDAGVKLVSQAEYDAAVSAALIQPTLSGAHSALTVEEIVNAFCLLSDEEQTVCLLKLHQERAKKQKVQTEQKLMIHESKERKAFLERIERMKLQYSYIAVLLVTFLNVCDNTGAADFDIIIHEFGAFYENRIQQGLAVEQKNSVFVKLKSKKPSIRSLILYNPLGRSFLKHYLYYEVEDNSLRMKQELWDALSPMDIQKIQKILNKRIMDYYLHISR